MLVDIARQAGHLIGQAVQRAEYGDGLASKADHADAWLRGLGRKPGRSQ